MEALKSDHRRCAYFELGASVQGFCLPLFTEHGGLSWNVAVFDTQSLFSSVLSAYRGTVPAITGLKCVFNFSKPALCIIKK